MRVGPVAGLYVWPSSSKRPLLAATWDKISAHMLLLRVIEHRQEPALADAATEDLGAAFDALDGALAHRRLVGRVARALAVVEVARRRRQLARQRRRRRRARPRRR